jgi:hypothetical protein
LSGRVISEGQSRCEHQQQQLSISYRFVRSAHQRESIEEEVKYLLAPTL